METDVPPVALVTILNDEKTCESVEKRERNFVPMQAASGEEMFTQRQVSD